MDFDAVFLTDLAELVPDIPGQEGIRQDDPVHLIAPEMVLDLLFVADHRHAVDQLARIPRLPGKEAGHVGAAFVIGFNLAADHAARISDADDHDVHRVLPGASPALLLNEPVGESDQGGQTQLNNRPDDVIGHGHPMGVAGGHASGQGTDDQQGDDHMGHRRRHVGQDDPIHVVQPGVLPHAPVEPEQGKDQDRRRRIPGNDGCPEVHIEPAGFPEGAVNEEPEIQRRHIGKIDGHDIQQHDPDIVMQEIL